MITSAEQMIRQYVAAWNEQDLEAYTRGFSEIWTDEATYTDPDNVGITGVKGLAKLAADSLPKAPTRFFSVEVEPDCHHGYGWYTWRVEVSGRTKLGVDFFEYNEAFKITRLVSFFKPL